MRSPSASSLCSTTLLHAILCAINNIIFICDDIRNCMYYYTGTYTVTIQAEYVLQRTYCNGRRAHDVNLSIRRAKIRLNR